MLHFCRMFVRIYKSEGGSVRVAALRRPQIAGMLSGGGRSSQSRFRKRTYNVLVRFFTIDFRLAIR